MRQAAADGRAIEQVGPFLATFSLDSDNPFLNYAVPDDGARPTPSDVDALTDAYRGRELLPRVEYLAETAPELENVLLGAGWRIERRIPVMLCPPAAAVDTPAPAGFELLVPTTDEEFRGLIAAQFEAFEQPGEVTADAIAKSRAAVQDGGFAVLAREIATGAAAGGGVAEAVVSATSEVAGIAVRPEFRKRGLGGAITAFLTAQAHAAGGRTVFLTPAGPTEQRMYERVGYQPAGDMLHISR